MFNSFFEEVRGLYGNDVYISGEFRSLTGGPKTLEHDSFSVRKYIGVKCIGDITFSIDLPPLIAEMQLIHHSHTIDKSFNADGLSICTARHPMGIFESAINSFNALASEYIQVSLPLEDEEKVRKELALYKCTNPTIRSALISYLDTQMNEYADAYHRKVGLWVVWEDYLSLSILNAKRIARSLSELGFGVSHHDLLEALIALRYANLLCYHKHNYRPGHAQLIGWQAEIPDEIIEEVTSLESFKRYHEMLTELSYVIPKEPCTTNRCFSQFKAEASIAIQEHRVIDVNLDSDLKTFSLNKSNVNQDYFRDEFIINERRGNVVIHRMSAGLEGLYPILDHLSLKIDKLWDEVEKRLCYYAAVNSEDLTPSTKTISNASSRSLSIGDSINSILQGLN